MLNFKFEIGEEVHTPLLRQNGVIEYQQFYRTKDMTRLEYGVVFFHNDTATSQEISEKWLEKGHHGKYE